MAKITPIEDGPLIVAGVPNLKTEQGEIEPEKPVYGLCRCGKSQNKPFCDGTHVKAEFTSANGDAKIRNSAVSYTGEVEGQQVKILYTPVLCGHIADCQRLHRVVFDPSKKPWIQPENGTLEGIKSVISACPSGALRMAIGDEAEHHIDGEDVSVSVNSNGPYVVKNVELDAEFNGVGASEKEYRGGPTISTS